MSCREGHLAGAERPERALRSVAGKVRARAPRLGAVRLVAVDGPSGAGKSTFASALAGALDAALVSTDDFATWDDPVAWWPRLERGVLGPLAAGRPGRYRRTEWPDGQPVPGSYVDVPVAETLVLEGVSAGRRALRQRLSYLVWVELADPWTRLERAVARDGEASREPLLAWQGFERGWFEVDRARERADQILEISNF